MSTPEQRQADFDTVVDKILAPFSKPLAKVLAPIVQRARADAWDEGHNAKYMPSDSGPPTNPYRED